MGLLTSASVAIDGSKFKAVNTSDSEEGKACFVAQGPVAGGTGYGGWCLAHQLAQLHSFDLNVRRMDDLAPFGRILA
jgi:hypothetical protein